MSSSDTPPAVFQQRQTLAANILFAVVTFLPAPHRLTPHPIPQELIMVDAQGTFDLKIAPTGHAPDDTLQSLSLAKVFHGALEGTSKGEMLASGGPPSGNGGYVALERFQGTLAGHAGTFVLMHSGVMSQGSAPQLSVQVVPGSGTGELSGLHGTMTIAVDANRQHTYTLHYGLSDK